MIYCPFGVGVFGVRRLVAAFLQWVESPGRKAATSRRTPKQKAYWQLLGTVSAMPSNTAGVPIGFIGTLTL